MITRKPAASRNIWAAETPGKWRPTPPDYMDGVEFCWGQMHPLLIDFLGHVPAAAAAGLQRGHDQCFL